jgi:hypothetical protein
MKCKIIKIDSCLNCQYFFDTFGNNFCQEGDIQLPNDIDYGYIHPDCPLDDYPEYYDEMLQALIDIYKSTREYDCKQCGNKRNIENCGGCVLYVDNLIEKVTGLPIEEVLK